MTLRPLRPAQARVFLPGIHGRDFPPPGFGSRRQVREGTWCDEDLLPRRRGHAGVQVRKAEADVAEVGQKVPVFPDRPAARLRLPEATRGRGDNPVQAYSRAHRRRTPVPGKMPAVFLRRRLQCAAARGGTADLPGSQRIPAHQRRAHGRHRPGPTSCGNPQTPLSRGATQR
jgi:hypothetical protein